MNKRVVVIGFMLFALFFGAGNLIFPPNLGWSSGEEFWPAILGMIVTGVGLPLLGVIAASFSKGGFREEANRVHPAFSVIFMVTIYLTIGPFFAIPRTATVSYEMGVLPYVDSGESIYLLIFSLIYFLIVYILSIRPSKIVSLIGKILTPLLLLFIVALVVRAFFVLTEPVTTFADKFNPDTPFFNGFLEGYQTMDTIAAIAFSIIVLQAIKVSGYTNQKDICKSASVAAIIAGIFLALVYLSLGWVGNHFYISPEALTELNAQKQDLGTYILVGVVHATYGFTGKLLISSIVGLACLTTSVGLIVAVSSFFYELWPSHSYKVYVSIFTLISFGLANQGLSQVIKGSKPALFIIYPIAMVLITLILIHHLLHKLPRICMQLPIYITILVSFLSVLTPDLLMFLPFSAISLHWITPAVAAFFIALVIEAMRLRQKKP